MQLGRPEARLQASLQEITRLLERHAVLEAFTHRQQTARRDLLEHLQHQQNVVELQARCRTLHPADLAYILGSSQTLGGDGMTWSAVGHTLAAVCEPRGGRYNSRYAGGR